MLINLPLEAWPHVWVKSANRFGEIVDITPDGKAMLYLDEAMVHQVVPPIGYSSATEVELYDIYRFHTTVQ